VKEAEKTQKSGKADLATRQNCSSNKCQGVSKIHNLKEKEVFSPTNSKKHI
jgi:hypothetical protein